MIARMFFRMKKYNKSKREASKKNTDATMSFRMKK